MLRLVDFEVGAYIALHVNASARVTHLIFMMDFFNDFQMLQTAIEFTLDIGG